MSFGLIYRLFGILLRIYSKKLPKNLNSHSRSNLKIAQNKKKKNKKKIGFRTVHLRVLNAKNQRPRQKTVAYRPQTDRRTRTDRQTDR